MQNAVQMKPVERTPREIDTRRYARCLEVSKRISWDIDRHVIRGREFDFSRKFLPDGLSKVGELGFLTQQEKTQLSQVQGRTYANMFGLVERFISAKVLELSAEHRLGDQTALEALVRFTDEELKHQELFRRIERLIAAEMPAGYRFVPRPNDIAWFVLGKSTWAVLALTCMIEIFSQAHYRESIAWDGNLSALYKDVFLFHWKEESQHAILDELEWRREDAKLTSGERDDAVSDFITLLGAVDSVVRAQADADAEYFIQLCARAFSTDERRSIGETLVRAYRRQYIDSGLEDERFERILEALVSDEQRARIASAKPGISHA
jgi:hypothetical protein